MRNFALQTLRSFEAHPDKGPLLENFVFAEFTKHTDKKIHFWRTKEKAEVDFVLGEITGETLPIEVKATSMKSPEISRSFRSFLASYKPKDAYVVNLDFHDDKKIANTNVHFVHPYEIRRILKTNFPMTVLY